MGIFILILSMIVGAIAVGPAMRYDCDIETKIKAWIILAGSILMAYQSLSM